MFNRIKTALKKFVDNVASQIASKELKEKDLDPLLEELVISLVETDVALEVAEALAEELKKRLIGVKVPRFKDTKEVIIDALRESIESILSRNWKKVDIVAEALRHSPSEPLKMMFFGVNGVGKTTTIAKFAYLFKKKGITPVIVASDTFRAGAQEQLQKHAEKLNVPFIGGKYGADPASVAYDAIEYARNRGYRVVLIDTAGRMHTDVDLINELRKIVRVSKPNYKVLIVDALTGNDAVEQARFFNDAVGVDFIVLTKVDADVKGGTALSVAYTIRKPILFIGVGQRYEDLEYFEPREFAKKIVEGLT